MNRLLGIFTVGMAFLVIGPLINGLIFSAWIFLQTMLYLDDIIIFLRLSYATTGIPSIIVSLIYSYLFFKPTQSIKSLRWKVPTLGAAVYFGYGFIFDMFTNLLGASLSLIFVIALLSIGGSLFCTIILNKALYRYKPAQPITVNKKTIA